VRLLADENIPRASISKLRRGGHDVSAIGEIAPGATDREVLALAYSERRVLISFDRDYGRLIWMEGLPPPPAVLYCRFVPAFPAEPAEIIEALLTRGESAISGHFVVVERDGTRVRSF
jgi:predicted nuclease of predicted toxin-antitoxin system